MYVCLMHFNRKKKWWCTNDDDVNNESHFVFNTHVCSLCVCMLLVNEKIFFISFQATLQFFLYFLSFPHVLYIYILWMDIIIYLMYVKKYIWCLCMCFVFLRRKKNRCCISNFYIHMYRSICLSYTCTPR